MSPAHTILICSLIEKPCKSGAGEPISKSSSESTLRLVLGPARIVYGRAGLFGGGVRPIALQSGVADAVCRFFGRRGGVLRTGSSRLDCIERRMSGCTLGVIKFLRASSFNYFAAANASKRASNSSCRSALDLHSLANLLPTFVVGATLRTNSC